MDGPEPTVTILRPDIAGSRTALDREERLVKDGILRMGSLVESQIRDAIRSLVERDIDLAEKVIAGDAAVNDAQREIADTVITAIATQQPVARDLRFLMGLTHVASELERIGDHASGIAKQARRLFEEAPLREIRDLAKIGNLAADQVRGVVSALIDIDDRLARQVAARDDEIDHGYSTVFTAVIDLMRADPRTVERGTRVILAAHWVERIGDRVTNVAEDVVYLATGQVEDLKSMNLDGADALDAVATADGPRPIKVIFVCTGNSARSQMAEALLRHDGGNRFEVVSAGVSPRGVHPLAIEAMAAVGIDISDAKSKPVGGFLGQHFDYVITLCDRARATCPVFPGGSETLHWGLDDPAEAQGTDAEQRAVFDRVLKEVSGRLHAFVPLALSRAEK